ncbi:MAG: hydrolase [Alphaproteobacteria bacterium]|nr:hydrolase [Alphaproteobacteria bacterium]
MWGDFCTHCGAALSGHFPKKCTNGHWTYLSPVAVGVALQPVLKDGKTGLLGVQRNIPPFKGDYALPGGFAENEDTPPETAARELFEETGVVQKSEEAKYFTSFAGESHNDADARRHTVNFFSMPALPFDAVDWTRSDHEVIRLAFIELSPDGNGLVIEGTETILCFPSHDDAAIGFLQQFKEGDF